ncbi:MAG: PKD domain-containing protein [Candidatus Colwellbacteria bacterium]|nr:PKD domain-containing protein [Candidatus Colwellbacteria bacterium]
MSKKVLLVSLAVIAIIGAALLVPTGKRSFNANIFGERKILGKAKDETQTKDVLSKAKTFFEDTSEKVRETATKSVEAAKTFAAEKAVSTAQALAGNAERKARELALNVLRGVEENIGEGNILPTNTVQVIPPEGITSPPISYLAKLGSTISFSIRKSSLPEFVTFNLSLDWGDGTMEEKLGLSNEENQTFSHTWSVLGTYQFQFKVSSGNATKTYTGSVTVIE